MIEETGVLASNIQDWSDIHQALAWWSDWAPENSACKNL